jgi:outer membrane lipoprotein-sorting protein
MKIIRFLSGLSGILMGALLLLPVMTFGAEVGLARQKLGPKEAQAFLALAEKNLGAMKSLRAEFRQEKHLTMFSDVIKSRGVLAFARPNQLRWEIIKPFRSLLIVNGQKVAKFDSRDGKPRKLKLGAEKVVREITNQVFMWHQGRFRQQSGAYQIEVFGGPVRQVVLRPKNPKLREAIKAIELRFSKDLTRIMTVTIRESGGDFTRLTFINEQQNKKMPQQYFSVERPAFTQLQPETSARDK